MAHSVLERKASSPNSSTLEFWIPVVGWEGIYEVSRRGELRSVDRRIVGPTGYDRHMRGQPKRIHFDKDGYARASLARPGHSVTAQMHVLVCEAFHGPRPTPQSEVCHANDIRSDNRTENLSWGTRQSNAAEMAQRNRIKGAQHPRAKLTAFQAFMIQESPMRHSELAKKLQIPYHQVRNTRVCHWQWL